MAISDRLSRFLLAYQLRQLTEAMEALNDLGFDDEDAAKFLNNLSRGNNDSYD